MVETTEVSEERKQVFEQELAAREKALDRITGLKDIGHTYHDLGLIVLAMKILGLRTHRGRTYGELKQLHEYVGRMFFHRRLTVSAQAFQYSGAVGLDSAGGIQDKLPRVPSSPKLEFRLEGLDGRRLLVCEIGTWTDWESQNHLTREELKIGMKEVEGRFHSFTTCATMHYLAEEEIPGKTGCWICGSEKCMRRVLLPTEDIDTAYQRQGVGLVWWVLDGLWGMKSAARPMKHPLTQRTLRIRTLVHLGQIVKVIVSEDEPYFGVLQEVITDDSGEITAIRLEQEQWEALGTSFWPVDIPANKILEILPKRETRDEIFGMISYL